MLIKCPECKKKISNTVNVCPNCGKELTEDDKVKAFQKQRDNANKKKIMVAISIFFVVAITIITAVCIINHNYNVKKQQEEQKKQEQAIKDFWDNSSAYYSLLSVLLVNEGTYYDKLESIWKNAIYKTSDTETDKFTKDETGEFYDDFNDAFSSYYDSDDYETDRKDVTESRETEQLYYEEIVKSKPFNKEVEKMQELAEEAHKICLKIEDNNDFKGSVSYNEFTENMADYSNELQDKIQDINMECTKNN